MGDQNPIQQLGPGRPHHSASDASDHFGPSVVHIDTSDGSSTEDMASDSDFTVVSSRRLKRKIRRTSPTGPQAPKKASSMRSYTISYVPTSTTDILNSLNRQSLSEYFELVAPGQVAEIRINARKNILSMDVTTKSILDTLKAIVQLGNIPVRAFSAYDKETTTGVIYDVDEDITDSSLEKLLSSSSPIVGFHRFGRSRCVKIVFQSDTLPTHVKVGYVRHSARPYVPRPLQCHKCLKFGHVSAVCKGAVTCKHCGGLHDGDNCNAAAKCPNCSGAHDATSKECPKMRNEISIMKKMVRDRSTHREAARAVRRRRHRSRLRRKRSSSVHRVEESTPKAKPSSPPRLLLAATKDGTQDSAPSQSTQAQGKQSLALNTSELQWPSLPSRAACTPLSYGATAPNEDNEKMDNADVKSMLKNLMGSMRKILGGLNTPAAKAAVQLLEVLEPLLVVLQ